MKKLSFKKYLVALSHIIFWFVSFNFWNVILNPSVESTTSIQGVEVGWDVVLLLNSAFLIYSALPFVWLIKRRLIWLKLLLSAIFATPIIYLITLGKMPAGQESDIAVIADWYTRNFLYVVVFHLPIAFGVYFNINRLINKYLNQNHFLKYLWIILGLCITNAIAGFSVFNFLLDKVFPEFYYISYFKIGELILINAGYLLFTSFLYLVWHYVKILMERKEAVQSELTSLKAQINPHFLFNNLNTIYSMASQNDQRTPDVVLKLSDFLRYVLYDTSSEFIPLEKEVEMIKTYIGLQKERINPETTTVEFETEGNFGKTEIAPLLLLPLVENCFKHGVGKDSGSIRIFAGWKDGKLYFQTENTVALREVSLENGGIGIKNVEKRLNLIYPDRHSLVFKETGGIFKLDMKIQLA